MSGSGIDVEITGDFKDTELMLSSLLEAVSPLTMTRFMMEQMTPYLEGRAATRFTSEGDDVVGSWAPLKPATEAIRQSKGFPPSHPINKRTGQLEDFILHGGKDFETTADAATMFMPGYGTGVSSDLMDKLTTAQMGKSYPSTVARPVIGLDETDLAAALTMLGFWVQEKVVARTGGVIA